MFLRGMVFWRRRLQCFGGAWHFGGCCSVLEGRGILQKPLAGCLQCFGGVWHFGAVVLEGCGTFGRRLQGCDIFGGRLKCFGGAWHFGGRLKCFEGV